MANEKRLIWDEDAKRYIIALAVGHHTDTLPVDREKLIELLADVGLCHYNTIADHLIANGVTIPVRCGECGYWDEIKHGYGWCCLDKTQHKYAKEEEFCSFGERRNDV